MDLSAFAAPRCERLLDGLFAHPIWKEGPIEERRVLWTDAEGHRRSACFNARGVYIWGVHDRPLYVGKTATSFRHRFSRYIWPENSQCRLAMRIDPKGEELPEEIVGMIQRNRRLKVRVAGSARFAREGILDIWFALFPIADARYIEAMEGVLIPAVNDWNRRRGVEPLLNVHGAADE